MAGFEHKGRWMVGRTFRAFCGTVYVERRSAHAKTPSPSLKRAKRRLDRKQLERKQSR